jgi:hypothetical protein
MGELECLEALSFSYAITSSFEKGFSTAYESIDISKKHAPIRQIFGINMMGLLYQKLGDDNEALKWAQKSILSSCYKTRQIILRNGVRFSYWHRNMKDLTTLTLRTISPLKQLDYSKRYFPFPGKLSYANISTR